MNSCTRVLMTACAGLFAMSALGEGAQGRTQADGALDCRQALVDRFDALSGEIIGHDDEIIPALVLLREEEKLARDVYLTFSEWYELPLFTDIALSEQNHMDLVAMVLERHGIADPAAGKGIGEFDDPKLQELFDDLFIPMGEASLVGALSAGAIIEDLDIDGLVNILSESRFLDINLVVENLVASSRSHMRRFVTALKQRGETYFPSFYVDKNHLALILSSEMETAVVYDEHGEVLATCGQHSPAGDRP